MAAITNRARRSVVTRSRLSRSGRDSARDFRAGRVPESSLQTFALRAGITSSIR